MCLLLAIGCTERVVLVPPGDASAWFDAAWTARVPITFTRGAGLAELTDFPVLVVLDETRFDYELAASDGRDVRVVDASGQVLAHAIERWVPGGTSHVWVRAPRVPGGRTEAALYLYFGNPAAGAPARAAVFGDEYAAVYHLSDEDDAILDASAAANDGVNQGTTPVEGRVAGARHFDWSAGQHVTLRSAGLPDGSAPLTLCAWASVESLEMNDHFTIFAYGAEGRGITMSRWMDDHRCTVDGTLEVRTPGIYTPGRARYVCCVLSEGEITLYVDGVRDVRDARTWSFEPGTAHLGSDRGGAYYWDGMIDEVRVSRVARDAEWIDAEYRSMTGTLVEYGPLETR